MIDSECSGSYCTSIVPREAALIRLCVPGTLSYRNIAVRVVTDACKRVGRPDCEVSYDGDGDDEFEAQVVSAFGEAFNNLAIHGYAPGYDGATEASETPKAAGTVDITIEIDNDSISIEMVDSGRIFDPHAVPYPVLEHLPENGMGLFIIRSFIDELSYEPGPPNRLRMFKRRRGTLDGDDELPPSNEVALDEEPATELSSWRLKSSPPAGQGQAIAGRRK